MPWELPLGAKNEHAFPTHRHRWFLIVLVGVIFFGIGWISAQSRSTPPNASVPPPGGAITNIAVPAEFPKTLNFDLFWNTWNLVKERSVDRPIDDRTLFYGALKGIVGSLKDPHSVLLDPSEAKRFSEDLSGSFQGIGAEIGFRKNQLVIVAPLPESPAERAGIKSGDFIVAIDGVDAFPLSLEEAVLKIRGKKGTVVKLKIARPNLKEPKEISITRDTIEVKSVLWKWADATSFSKIAGSRRIAVVKISSFDEKVRERFSKVTQEMIVGGVQGIVLDLRNDPGGLLDAAVEISGEWIDHNLVVIEQRGPNASSERIEYRSQSTARLEHIPTVILVNQGSASASEILSGALQDYGKAILVGTKTFGKGSVQELSKLPDGSALKLTIAKWLTPHGRLIDKEGIAPDILVEPLDKENAEDVQLKRALQEVIKKMK